MPPASDAIVGRERELAAIGELLAAPETWPRALLIEGAAGAGKTALWTAATAEGGGRRVLRARPSGAEAQFAFSALGDLLDGVADAALPELPGPQRHALEAALLLGDDPAPHAEPRAVGVAVLGVLRRLAAAGPVVVGVDDEQWLDAASAAVLAFALRRLTSERVVTVLARRSAGADEPVRGVGAVLDAARVTRVTPAPLELDAIRRLLEARLGTSWSRPALVRIREASGGNPLYAIELGRALVREGAQATAAERLPAPTTLRGLLSDRLSHLPPATLDVLAIAATLDQPTLAVVKAVAGRDVTAELRAAIADGVIEVAGTRIRFSHPLLAVVVHAELSAERRREIHRQLAGVLDEPEQRAMHLALAATGPDEPTAAELALAAERAHGRGASLSAAELAEHARRLTPTENAAAARGRALASADYAFAAGGIDAARAILEAEVRTVPAGAPRAEVLVRLALLDTYDGDLVAGRDRAEAALAEDPADPPLRVVVHRRLSMILLLRGELAAAEEHARAALRLAEELSLPATIAQATASHAFLRAVRGRPVARARLERLAGEARVAGPATIDDSPTAVLGLLAMYAGDEAAARSRFEACIADATERGDEPSLAGLLFCRAEVECRAGRFAEAAAFAERGLEASLQTGQRLTRAVSLFAKGLAAAHLGHADEARAAAEEGVAIAARAGHRFAEAQNTWVLGLLELSTGGFGEAAEAFGRVLAFAGEAGLRHPGVLPVAPDAAEALLGAGELDAAEAVLARLKAARPAGRLAVAERRSRALVLAARGDPGEAVRELETLEPGSAYEAGRVLLALGQVQRRAKRKAPAREALTAARDRFRECGARLWEAAAERELARIGGRPPASEGLTPTERRVAALVAEGRSNKQVAAALFVTVSTVEAHLSRIYAKLGVRSRAELAARGPGTQSMGIPGVSGPQPQP